MDLLSVGIRGIGAFVPPAIVSNLDLEKTLDTSDDWIRTRTGISARRRCSEAEATSDLAVEAAKMALASSGTDPGEIDLVIVATMTPDRLWPSTASAVQGRLGAKRAAAFDLNAACSGFVYALAVGTQMVRSGFYRKVLVIGADAVTKFLDWTDRSVCVLFGDGAGAVVLEPVDGGAEGLIGFFLGSDGTRGDIMHIPAGGSRLPPSHETLDGGLHSPRMDGYETFQFATFAIQDSIRRVLSQTSYALQDLSLIVPHQANSRIISATAKWLDLPESRFSVHLDRFGNTVAGSIPICLYEDVQSGRLKKGDLIALTSFGSGLTWAAALVRWLI